MGQESALGVRLKAEAASVAVGVRVSAVCVMGAAVSFELSSPHAAITRLLSVRPRNSNGFMAEAFGWEI